MMGSKPKGRKSGVHWTRKVNEAAKPQASGPVYGNFFLDLAAVIHNMGYPRIARLFIWIALLFGLAKIAIVTFIFIGALILAATH